MHDIIFYYNDQDYRLRFVEVKGENYIFSCKAFPRYTFIENKITKQWMITCGEENSLCFIRPEYAIHSFRNYIKEKRDFYNGILNWNPDETD